MDDHHDDPVDNVNNAIDTDDEEAASLPDTPEDRTEGWAGVDAALGGSAEGNVDSGYGSETPTGSDRKP
ncbi:MAG: hypothetical protein ACR2GO_01485 [Candidatus Limnocylindria bacterium]